MNIATEALNELFPNSNEDRKFVVSYSGKFKGFNANVKYNGEVVHFSLSKSWKDFGKDLRKGVIQHLLVKMYPKRKYEKTFSLDLYEKFIENVGRYSKVSDSEPDLEESFNRINEIYFNGLMEKPNLIWGKDAFRKLGHYEYVNNTVVISSIFQEEPELLDYIMYHELLHKKLPGKISKTGRVTHHSSEFKREEAKFMNKDVERKLKIFLRKKRLKNIFRVF